MKSIHREEFALFTRLLREIRQEAGLTQVTIAEKLGRPQNVVSTIELGRLRLDFLQLRDWCLACDTTVIALASRFEERLAEHEAESTVAQRKGATKKGSSSAGGAAASAAKLASKATTKAVKSKP